jgi:hypothetical protein
MWKFHCPEEEKQQQQQQQLQIRSFSINLTAYFFVALLVGSFDLIFLLSSKLK